MSLYSEMSEHHATDTPYEDLLARAASAISDADLGHMGWALNKPRENKALPEEANEFLRELFARGEEDSSAKVSRRGMPVTVPLI